MNAAGLLRYYYLSYLSQPAHDRTLYSAIGALSVRSVLEIGLGDCLRASRIIEILAPKCVGHGQTLSYCGMDRFELRKSADPRLAIREAFKRLNREGIRLRLAPGEPAIGIWQIANYLREVDLVVISYANDDRDLTEVWRLLPRMLSPTAVVFRETLHAGKKLAFQQLTADNVRVLAERLTRERRRSA